MLEKLLLKYAKKYEGMPIALSGGIDSGLLSALIKPKFAITVELPESKHNEIEYAKKVADHLKLKLVVVKYNEDNFEQEVKTAVKAIGRPIPHFNILPLFQMYRKLNEMGEKEVVLGDGPDETMCGYARDLIINYLYSIYGYEAFKNYKLMIDKLLLAKDVGISLCINQYTNEKDVSAVNIKIMRPDMDDMSNGIAKHFGITNHRPYQDNKEIDDYMFKLPMSEKIWQVEYGKYALRKIADKYLPKEIAWRKEKVGGPLYSPNFKMNWFATEGEYGKKKWMNYQKEILK